MKKREVLGMIFFMLICTGCGVPNKFAYVSEFGKNGKAPGDFSNPVDMEMSPDESLLIADSGQNKVMVISPDGSFKMSMGEYGTTGFKIQSISGIGVNSFSGDILVCDLKGGKIVKFNKAGSPIFKITDKVKGPLDVAFDKQGNIYAIMARQPAIYKYDSAGKFIATIGGTGKTALGFPLAIKIRNDTIFVADSHTRRILKLALNGEYMSQFSSKGEEEPMKSPAALSIDEKNGMYVVDAGEVPVVALAEDGKLFSRIGEFGDTPGSYMYPRGIVISDSNEVFILDNNRGRIIKFKKASN